MSKSEIESESLTYWKYQDPCWIFSRILDLPENSYFYELKMLEAGVSEAFFLIFDEIEITFMEFFHLSVYTALPRMMENVIYSLTYVTYLFFNLEATS